MTLNWLVNKTGGLEIQTDDGRSVAFVGSFDGYTELDVDVCEKLVNRFNAVELKGENHGNHTV
jgi:hypothetical protein